MSGAFEMRVRLAADIPDDVDLATLHPSPVGCEISPYNAQKTFQNAHCLSQLWNA